MTNKPAYHGPRQTRGWLLVGRTTAARFSAVTTLIALTLVVTTLCAMGAPLHQSTTDAADREPPTNGGATTDAGHIAAIAAVLNHQGVQGPLTLQRVSAVAVPNLMTEPALVVDARAKRIAEAEATEAEVALSVQATVEAQAAEAVKAADLEAIEEAQSAAASATAAAMATETARNSAAEAEAVLLAKQEAEVRAAEFAATKNVETPAAAEAVSHPLVPDRMSFLMIALTPMLGGILGLRLWRSRKEPFVLKANPIPAHSSAPA
jgi:hypothetical protein